MEIKTKKCFKCDIEKTLSEFYKHPDMPDGTVNKCKECNRVDNKASNGKQKRVCQECGESFNTTINEIRRRGGGGYTCSRACYYKRLRKIVKKDEDSPNWKGDGVGKTALHQWVIRNLGNPKKCEHCGRTDCKKYEWANKSQKYKRDLSDWLRLCTKCHAKYDYPTRHKKWLKAVRKIGWKPRSKTNYK